METAEIIASHLGLSVEVDARLRETDMGGPYAGMRADEIPLGGAQGGDAHRELGLAR